jgi:hypothetical protein
MREPLLLACDSVPLSPFIAKFIFDKEADEVEKAPVALSAL